MSNLKKHVGVLRNTSQRCAVVFMQLPDRPDYSLVVATDSLPPRVEASLMSVLESPESQSTRDLANVLARRVFSDTGNTFLQELHELGLLHAVPVDNVIMMPAPNMPFPLRQILESMGDDATPLAPEVQEAAPEVKFNPYGDTADQESSAEAKSIALNLINEAIDLESIAASKRENAYRYDPSLRPQPKAAKAPSKKKSAEPEA